MICRSNIDLEIIKYTVCLEGTVTVGICVIFWDHTKFCTGKLCAVVVAFVWFEFASGAAHHLRPDGHDMVVTCQGPLLPLPLNQI